ncbi:MAG: SDR family oxidoreductase, partial [Gemmatimonadota bacterium]|nr:SDR family oxidoreductase [Gemmatimonadota bacterium]
MTEPADLLAGRVALLTGAASGIGRATAHLFASRGAIIYASDLEEPAPEAATRASGSAEWTGLRLDVRSEVDWEAVIRLVLEERGRLDILVHAAGVASASPLTETPFETWRDVLSTNLDGTFLAIRHGVRA